MGTRPCHGLPVGPGKGSRMHCQMTLMALLPIRQDNQWEQNTSPQGWEWGQKGRLGFSGQLLLRYELSFRSLVTAVSKAETSPGSFSSCGTKYKSVLEEMLLAERQRGSKRQQMICCSAHPKSLVFNSQESSRKSYCFEGGGGQLMNPDDSSSTLPKWEKWGPSEQFLD